jgi:ABC-2 type transport system permease protein
MSLALSAGQRSHRAWPETIHAEWTKLRTLASTWWLLAGAAALTVTVSAATVAAAVAPGLDPAKLSLTGIQAGQAVVAILAVLVISNEYSTGMIRVTLTAMPRRHTVLAAKAALVGGLVLAAGAVAVLASVLAGRLILPGHGFTPANGYQLLSPGDGPALRAACGSVLYLALIALLALGVATVVRDSAVAIGGVLALLYLFPIVAAVVSNQHWQRHLEQIGPMTAGPVHPGHGRRARAAAHPLAGPRRARAVGGRSADPRRASAQVPRRVRALACQAQLLVRTPLPSTITGAAALITGQSERPTPIPRPLQGSLPIRRSGSSGWASCHSA